MTTQILFFQWCQRRHPLGMSLAHAVAVVGNGDTDTDQHADRYTNGDGNEYANADEHPTGRSGTGQNRG